MTGWLVLTVLLLTAVAAAWTVVMIVRDESPPSDRFFVVLGVLLLALVTGRRRSKKREQATTYVVEQLRQERQALEAPAALALAEAEQVEEHTVREELSALIERQPEDVATLLRGWLVER